MGSVLLPLEYEHALQRLKKTVLLTKKIVRGKCLVGNPTHHVHFDGAVLLVACLRMPL